MQAGFSPRRRGGVDGDIGMVAPPGDDDWQERTSDALMAAAIGLVGIFLCTYGHKLKKAVLFVTGAVIPFFLYTVHFGVQDQLIKIALIGLLSLSSGCFFVANPKLGLGGVGFVAGALVGGALSVAIILNLPGELRTQEFNRMIDVTMKIVVGLIGALLLAFCYSKMYCIVVPFVGGVFAGDGVVKTLVVCCARYGLPYGELFPPRTPLLLNSGELTAARSRTPFRALTAEATRRVTRHVNGVGEFVSRVHGQDTRALSDSWETFMEKLHRFWAPWSLWVLLFVVFFSVGTALQWKEYKKEKEEKEKENIPHSYETVPFIHK